MKYYWVKTHRLIKRLYSNYLWSMPRQGRKAYLTFDDGPTPEITQWVLSQLDKYNAKATFFCIGKNIENHPGIFRHVVSSGHAVGNHTFNHVNGWHVADADYIKDVKKCEAIITANGVANRGLFRPPYGKLNRTQSKTLREMGYEMVMWDILSADFDTNITPEKCLENVLRNVNPGTIIIFHDSLKAFKNLEYALPKTLQFLSENGYEFATIPVAKK